MALSYTLQGKKLKSIALMVTLSGATHKFYTKITIHPSHWNDARQIIKGNSTVINEQNDFLGDFARDIEAHIFKTQKEGKTLSKEELKVWIDKRFWPKLDDLDIDNRSFIKYFEHEIKTSALADGTLTNYKTTLKNLLRYLETLRKTDISFEGMDVLFFNRYTTWLKKTGEFGKYSIDTKLKNLKTVLNKSLSEKLHSNIEFKNVKRPNRKELLEDTIHIYVSKDELSAMFDLELEKEDQRLMDCYLFSSYTAIRWEDLICLGKSNFIKEKDGGYSIDFYQQKTESRVRVPIIFKEAVEIAKRNNFSFAGINNDSVNKAVRRILNKHKLLQQTIQVNTSHTTGIFKKADLISYKIGRKTFATNCVLDKIPNNFIMAATGHKSESVFRNDYVKAGQIEKAAGLAAYRNY